MADEKNKGKPPAFQFYVMDFMDDASGLTATSAGVWIRCLCKLHRAKKRGQMTATKEAWARKCSCTLQEFANFLEENKTERVATVLHRNGNVTVVSRRMERERKEREDAAKRQREFRERQKTTEKSRGENGNVTAYSSPSPSSSLHNNNTRLTALHTRWAEKMNQNIPPATVLSGLREILAWLEEQMAIHSEIKWLPPEEILADEIDKLAEKIPSQHNISYFWGMVKGKLNDQLEARGGMD